MLPPAARLRRSEDFREVMRKGARAGRRRLVVHATRPPLPSSAEERDATESTTRLPAPPPIEAQRVAEATTHLPPSPSTGTAVPSVRAGFVVSKAVGNSVVRHRVARRLRHLIAARLGTLSAGATLVIRALPPSANASSAELGADLDGALKRLSLLTNPDEGPAV